MDGLFNFVVTSVEHFQSQGWNGKKKIRKEADKWMVRENIQIDLDFMAENYDGVDDVPQMSFDGSQQIFFSDRVLNSAEFGICWAWMNLDSAVNLEQI